MAQEIFSPSDGILFLELAGFITQSEKHLKPDSMIALQNTLTLNPLAGSVIEGTEGARKIRIGLPGRGKSGGARVIYYFLSLYTKNTKANLIEEDKKELRNEIRKIKQEDYP